MSQFALIVCPSCTATNRIPTDKTYTKVQCGKCGHPLFDPAPVVMDERRFDKFVDNSDIPVVVDFWAPWCGPCQMMGPVFEAVAQSFGGKIRFGKVDTEAHQALAARMAIRSIPTTILFSHGKERDRRSGAMNQSQLTQWIRETF